MNMILQTRLKAATPIQSLTPVNAGILQRSSTNKPEIPTAPRFGHDFSKIQVHSFVPEVEQGQRIKHTYSGKSYCSPTWYGDTSPEIDPSGGSFTGKLVVKYNDAESKDPCVRECVEQHENVHVKHLTPLLKKYMIVM